MTSMRRWAVHLFAAVLAFSASADSAGLELSGTVYGADKKPLPGVVVQLASVGLSTTTDAAGAWSLGSTASIVRSPVEPAGPGGLQIQGGRISIRFAGHDLLGRGQGPHAQPAGSSGLAARAAATPDTVRYSWMGKVRLRDTISASQSGMVRILDTNVNAAITHGYLTDTRDGQIYRTVRLGNQSWMAENLNYAGTGTELGVCYRNSADSCLKFGRLYTWMEVMNGASSTKLNPSGVRGICPTGWHVPSDAEWQVLEVGIGMSAEVAATTGLRGLAEGEQLKATRGWFTSWNVLGNGSDAYGFRALPGGDGYNGSFGSPGIYAYWWTATQNDFSTGYAWIRNLSASYRRLGRYNDGQKARGYSLRCVQNEQTPNSNP